MRVVKNYGLFKDIFACVCACVVTAPLMIAAMAAQPAWALSAPKQASSDPAGSQHARAKDCVSKPTDTPAQKSPGISSYVLGDSIGYGLHAVKLERRLREQLGGPSKISYDTGRSISSPGIQIKKSALESVDIDSAYIANAGVIIIILGTNQIESSFADSQRVLVKKLKLIAPQAAYYWVDIGATITVQAEGWSARNKVIYDQAPELGYSVISRYKAIFGPNADPLNIQAGKNFPDRPDEPGYGGPGNIHGAHTELMTAILEKLAQTTAQALNCKP